MINAYILWLSLIVVTVVVMGINNQSKPSHPALAYMSSLWDFLFTLFWAAFLRSYFFDSAGISLGKTMEETVIFFISASLPLWILYGWRLTSLNDETKESVGASLMMGLFVIGPLAVVVYYVLLSSWSLPKIPNFLG
jgi:hypothetical protein